MTMTTNHSPKCQKCGFAADVQDTETGATFCHLHQHLAATVTFLYEVTTDFPQIASYYR